MTTDEILSLPLHPEAERFAPMTGEEFHALKEDIRANGVHEPLHIFEGQIIDGRHRQRAARELAADGFAVAVAVRTHPGDLDVVSYVLSLNLLRRHLTTTQKACLGVPYKKQIQQEQKHGGDRRSKAVQDGNASILNGTARDLAGAKVGVSGRTIDEAEKIADKAPDLFAEMATGSLPLADAQRTLRAREWQETEAQRAEAREKKQEKAAPPVPDPQAGEWWALGDHRLYVGPPTAAAFLKGLPAKSDLGLHFFSQDDGPFDFLPSRCRVVLAALLPDDLSSFFCLLPPPVANLYRGGLVCHVIGDGSRCSLGTNAGLVGAVFARPGVGVDAREENFRAIQLDAAGGGVKGEPPRAFWKWGTELFTQRGDTILCPVLDAGEALLAAQDVGRALTGAVTSVDAARALIARWQQETGQQARLSSQE